MAKHLSNLLASSIAFHSGPDSFDVIMKNQRTTKRLMNLSPRAKSSSTLSGAADLPCSSPTPRQNSVKGYTLAVDSVRALQGDFPPADPYIYCQNDPNYKGHAATAVTISMFLGGGSHGVSGVLELGWKKARLEGDTTITKKIFVTARISSSAASYLPIDVADMPTTNFNLKILRDCGTGVPSFFLNGGDVTPARGTGPNQIDPAVWFALQGLRPRFVRTIVELHDIRSHAPGTALVRYVVLNCEYQTCSLIHPWSNALGEEQSDPQPPEVHVNKPNDETFQCWDTRNP